VEFDMNTNAVSLLLKNSKGGWYSFLIAEDNHPSLVRVCLMNMANKDCNAVPCVEWCREWVGDVHSKEETIGMLDGFEVLDLLALAKQYVYGVAYE